MCGVLAHACSQRCSSSGWDCSPCTAQSIDPFDHTALRIGTPAHLCLVALNPGMSVAAVSVLPLGLTAAVEDPLQVWMDVGGMWRQVGGRAYCGWRLRVLLCSAALQAGGWYAGRHSKLTWIPV